MPRESDAEARRLIAEVERLEGEPWPAALPELHATMIALANRCEFPPGQAEFYRWARRVVDPTSAGSMSAHQADGLADLAVDAFGWLSRCRAGLHPTIRPNLASMLVRAVRWRARGIARSLHWRHDERRGSADFGALAALDNPHTTAEAREVVVRLVGDGSAVARAVLLVGQGWTVSEAARRTGVGRPSIYRAMARLARVDDDDDGG